MSQQTATTWSHQDQIVDEQHHSATCTPAISTSARRKDESQSFVEKKISQWRRSFLFSVNYCEYHQYNRVLRFLTRFMLKKDDLGSPRGFGTKKTKEKMSWGKKEHVSASGTAGTTNC